MFLSWGLKMGAVLETRRSKTKSRFQELQVELQEAELLAGDKACVYATGSFGRGEASVHSDLDVFILDRGENGTTNPELSNLDEICIKANLIKTTRKLKIREFSRGGEYLVRYTVRELVQTLGKRTDDASNTFTARLLLLLESKPLFGKSEKVRACTE
jgi:predicted nucleotidyltransferase